MSIKSVRQDDIIKKLEQNQGLSVHALADMFNVTEMTIRRDLHDLDSKGYIRILNGVALLNKNTDGTSIIKPYALSDERDVMADAKRRIGQKAASFVELSDNIIIDTGTTTETIIPYLPLDSNLNIICHNTNILMGLITRGYRRIIFPGGFYHKNTEFFESSEAVSLISRSCVSKFFCSAAGVSSNGHITCIEQYEINTKQACLKSAIKSYLLCDSSKFGKIRPALFANINEFDAIITDSNIDSVWLDYFNSCDIEYYIV